MKYPLVIVVLIVLTISGFLFAQGLSAHSEQASISSRNKIIQIATMPEGKSRDQYLIVLCLDGNLWQLNDAGYWKRLDISGIK
jgi:hypothetical protein